MLHQIGLFTRPNPLQWDPIDEPTHRNAEYMLASITSFCCLSSSS